VLELRLQMTLGMQLQVTRGFAAPEAEEPYTRACDLSRQVGEPSQLFTVLWGLWLYYKVRSELPKARELAEQLYSLALHAQDAGRILQAHQALTVTSLCLGEPDAARRHLERATALYDPERHHVLTTVYGQDPGVACRSIGAVALWLLGFPDQAARTSDEAVRLSRDLGQPSSQALALHFAAMLRQCRREPAEALAFAEQATALAAGQGFSFWHAGGTVLRGWALAEACDAPAGIELLRQGLAAWRAIGSITYESYFLALLADALKNQGNLAEGWGVLEEALAVARRTSEGLVEAELYRLKGEFVLSRQGPEVAPREAEGWFRQAVTVARRQQAKSLELRAALSLSRLSRQEGRPVLAEAYGWFREGFATPDLQAAQALLQEIEP
jgi:predicted ATPase